MAFNYTGYTNFEWNIDNQGYMGRYGISGDTDNIYILHMNTGYLASISKTSQTVNTYSNASLFNFYQSGVADILNGKLLGIGVSSSSPSDYVTTFANPSTMTLQVRWGSADYNTAAGKTMTSTWSQKVPRKTVYNSTTNKYYSINYYSDVASDNANGKILVLVNNNDSTLSPNTFEELSFINRDDTAGTKPQFDYRKTSLANSTTQNDFQGYNKRGWDYDPVNNIAYFCTYEQNRFVSGTGTLPGLVFISKIDLNTMTHTEEFFTLLNQDANRLVSGIGSIYYDPSTTRLFIQVDTNNSGSPSVIYAYNTTTGVVDGNTIIKGTSGQVIDRNGVTQTSTIAINYNTLSLDARKIVFMSSQTGSGASQYSNIIFFDLDDLKFDFFKVFATQTLTIDTSKSIHYDSVRKILYASYQPSTSSNSGLLAYQFANSGTDYSVSITDSLTASPSFIINKQTNSINNQSLTSQTDILRSINKLGSLEQDMSISDSSQTKHELASFLMESMQANTDIDISNSIITFLNEYIQLNNQYIPLSGKESIIILNELLFAKTNSKTNTDMNVVISQFLTTMSSINTLDTQEILVLLSEVIKVKDGDLLATVNRILSVILSEIILTNDNYHITRNLITKISEKLSISNIFNRYNYGMVILSENVNIDINWIKNVDYKVFLQEILKASFLIKLGDDEYTAYCINLENNALTRYDNFNFNSYCQYKQNYYGMKSDGLYILQGENDNDDLVKGKVKTGYFNISNIQTKTTGLSSLRDKRNRIQAAYLLVSNNNEMVFRIYNDNNQSFDYKLSQVYDYQQYKQDIGKGISSQMFQFEFLAKGTFELNSAEIIPIVLDKRVGE